MTTFDRRVFLGAAAASLGGVRSWSLAAPGAEPAPRPCPGEAWVKGPVVLREEEGAAGREVQNFTSLAEPLDGGRWRLWCSWKGSRGTANIGYVEGVPGERLERHVALLSPGEPGDAPLALGNLPEGWRPVQPVHLRLRDGRHRLYFWAHGRGVLRYLAAESADGRKYRVIDPGRPCLYHHNDRAVAGATASEAGLKQLAGRPARTAPGDAPAAAGLISNDATNVYLLPDGTFEMYSVGLVEVPRDDPRYAAHDNAPGLIRVIDRRTSDDGLAWSDRQRVLVPDARDPVDQQFYYLAVTHTDRGRVGMLGHYRVQAQRMDLEWCFSADGVHWDRPLRRPWIPRGRPGEPDSYGIYAPHRLVHHANQWWLFYTGVNSAHNGKDAHGAPASAVMLARCPSIWT